MRAVRKQGDECPCPDCVDITQNGPTSMTDAEFEASYIKFTEAYNKLRREGSIK